MSEVLAEVLGVGLCFCLAACATLHHVLDLENGPQGTAKCPVDCLSCCEA